MLPGEMLRPQDTERCCHHPAPFLGCSDASLLSLLLGADHIQGAQACSDTWGHPGESPVPLSDSREGLVEEVQGGVAGAEGFGFLPEAGALWGALASLSSGSAGPAGALLQVCALGLAWGGITQPLWYKIAVIKPHFQRSSTKQKSKQWWLFAFIQLQTMQLGWQIRERRARLSFPHGLTCSWRGALFLSQQGRQQLGTTSQNKVIFPHGVGPGVKTG